MEPLPTEAKLISKPKLEETTDWQIYKNDKYGFEIKYPKDWVISNKDFIDAQPGALTAFQDKVSTGKVSPALVLVSAQKLEGNIKDWVKNHYSRSTPLREFSEDNINGIHFEKATLCSLGCYTYYVTEKAGMVYIIDLSKGDYNPEKNDQELINIINTFKFH